MDETLGDIKLRQVDSPNELVVGQKYFYIAAEEELLYQFSENDVLNMDFIPIRFLCRRKLIYKGKDNNGIHNFTVIKDTPRNCNREGESFVGRTLNIYDQLIYSSNNEERLYHIKIAPAPEPEEKYIGAGKKYRTKKLKSKRLRTRKNKRKSSLRKVKSKNLKLSFYCV